jgi:nucleoside-diphosphate-sugar epimerase
VAVQKVLITGIGGFTGFYVEQKFLELGCSVYGFTNTATTNYPNRFKVCLSDTARLTALLEEVQPDVVIHLAAVSYVAHDNVGDIYSTNITGTHNLLAALCSANCSPDAVVLASSANVYGNALVEPITEQADFSPANDYAISKTAMEFMANLWLDRLPIVVVRPFNYTGVGQSLRFLVPKIIKHFRDRKDVIELGNVNVYRDFSDVRTIAEIYTKVARSQHAGKVFNLCSGVGHSLTEIIELTSVLAGYQINIKVNPDFVRENEVKRLIGSSEILDGEIGAYTKYSLKDTLAWMYNDNTKFGS